MAQVDTATADEGWSVFDGLPGHPMMWVLILSELVVFGLLLGAFCVARALNPAVFAAGQAQLSPWIALANTVVLVTGGWLGARASVMARVGRPGAARAWLAAAMAAGLGFVALKGVEYAGEIAAGAGLEVSPFFTLYFLVTGFHALHVLLGVVILGAVAWSAEAEAVETGTAFWHMVDLVWLLLFPIIYLVK